MATNSETARRNKSTKATIYDMEKPFAEGSFRWVANGKYTEGERKGEECVAKWFKSGVVFKEQFFEKDLNAIDKALEILELWNKQGTMSEKFQLNKATVWTFLPEAGKWAGTKALTEPFIENYQKFNSNTGWKKESAWGKAIQAVSHFSYHVTGKANFLLTI